MAKSRRSNAVFSSNFVCTQLYLRCVQSLANMCFKLCQSCFLLVFCTVNYCSTEFLLQKVKKVFFSLCHHAGPAVAKTLQHFWTAMVQKLATQKIDRAPMLHGINF